MFNQRRSGAVAKNLQLIYLSSLTEAKNWMQRHVAAATVASSKNEEP